MGRKGSNPPPPGHFSKPPPSPAPPPKIKTIEISHVCKSREDILIFFEYLKRLDCLDRLEERLKHVIDEVTEIKKTVNGGK